MTTPDQIRPFQREVLDYYKKHARELPWRQAEEDGSFDPYKILVSEIMLQQTQVNRVIPKYQAFITCFPTLRDLAEAPLSRVLEEWSGLGYNRRAKYLHQAAAVVMSELGGKLPASTELLTNLPGVGKNTAAAIVVYSFNQAVVFIETNIRTVYLHHFFKHQNQITDAQLIPYIEASLDEINPRDWYWALMDYGSYLKQTIPNPNVRSKHFTRQSAFEGSVRQIRGQIIKLLTVGPVSLTKLQNTIVDTRLITVLGSLQDEGLISHRGSTYRLGK